MKKSLAETLKVQRREGSKCQELWGEEQGYLKKRHEAGLVAAGRDGWGLREVGDAFWKLWGETGWGPGTLYRAVTALEHKAPQVRACGQGLKKNPKTVKISGQS